MYWLCCNYGPTFLSLISGFKCPTSANAGWMKLMCRRGVSNCFSTWTQTHNTLLYCRLCAANSEGNGYLSNVIKSARNRRLATAVCRRIQTPKLPLGSCNKRPSASVLYDLNRWWSGTWCTKGTHTRLHHQGDHVTSPSQPHYFCA